MTFNYECPKCGKTSGYSLKLQEMLDDVTLKIYPYREDVPILIETRSGIAEIDYSTGRTEQWLAELSNPDRIHFAMAMCTRFKGGLDPFIELDCLECDTSYTIPIYRIPDFFTPLTTMDNTGL